MLMERMVQPGQVYHVLVRLVRRWAAAPFGREQYRQHGDARK